jgi:hypothetical protein
MDMNSRQAGDIGTLLEDARKRAVQYLEKLSDRPVIPSEEALRHLKKLKRSLREIGLLHDDRERGSSCYRSLNH